MPEYLNPNPYSVDLIGPDGKVVKVRKNTKVTLPEYFDRYCQRGFLRRVTGQVRSLSPQRTVTAQPIKVETKIEIKQHRTSAKPAAKTSKRGPVVGRVAPINPNDKLAESLARSAYPISNGIGVGILSYNRPTALRRLLDSISRYTNLQQTTVFISDDGSTDGELLSYLQRLEGTGDYVVLRNQQRLGVAGNSNRLLRCLSRFAYGILLNDDVEILAPGWEVFYPNVLRIASLHHLMFRQEGIYGAKLGTQTKLNGQELLVTQEKPHGAVLAFTNQFLNTAGYFNEQFGFYGLEHVDWSQKAWESQLQATGFYDVPGSAEFFKLYPEPSSLEQRMREFNYAKSYWETRQLGYVAPSLASQVPKLSCVVPCRNFERDGAIQTVINNLRAQRFPELELILVEQDQQSTLELASVVPLKHFLAPHNRPLFNKSKAFNYGVAQCTGDRLVLHDADTIATGDYLTAVYRQLQQYEACHLGATVIYADQASSQRIVTTGHVDRSINCERVVSYYEGGSLACRRDTYWRIGGFNEDYDGYGCFLPGNQVLTENGYKPIEEVAKSDRLYTHKDRFQPVELRCRQYRGVVYDLFIPGRLPIRGVTPEHPMLVQTRPNEFMWRKVSDLHHGDVIASTDFIPELVPQYNLDNSIYPKPPLIGSSSMGRTKFGTIYNIRSRYYDGPVYNFEVSEDHSYVVHGLIAHNCEDCDFYARLAGSSAWSSARTFDLIHLWHSRASGWEGHHANNKALEAKLKQLEISARIVHQHAQLRAHGYGTQLERALR